MSIYLFLFLSKNQFFFKCIEKDVVLRAETFNTECYNVASATMYQRNYKEKGDVYLLPPTEEMETVPRINSKRRGRKAQRPTTERIQRSTGAESSCFCSNGRTPTVFPGLQKTNFACPDSASKFLSDPKMSEVQYSKRLYFKSTLVTASKFSELFPVLTADGLFED